MIRARSTALISCRTLPGQAYRSSACMARSSISQPGTQEVLHQQRDVAHPLAQRGQLQRHHVDAVVQVLAEIARR